MNWIVDRIKEPSTWAGVGVIASVVAETAATLTHVDSTPAIVIALLTGLISVITKETGGSGK